jgi:hypothetical protein
LVHQLSLRQAELRESVSLVCSLEAAELAAQASILGRKLWRRFGIEFDASPNERSLDQYLFACRRDVLQTRGAPKRLDFAPKPHGIAVLGRFAAPPRRFTRGRRLVRGAGLSAASIRLWKQASEQPEQQEQS